MDKKKGYHLHLEDEGGERRKRFAALAKRTGFQRRYLAARIFDAGVRAVEATAALAEAEVAK